MIVNSVTNIPIHEKKIQQVTDHENLNDILKLRKNAQLHSVSTIISDSLYLRKEKAKNASETG